MPSKYTDEQRAAVIIDYKAGASLNQLAKDHGIPKSTAKYWCKGISRLAPVLAPKKPNEPSVDDWLEERAARLVDGSFGAIEAIDQLVASPRERAPGDPTTWAERQNAHDLAILRGVIADKLIRVLSSRPGRTEHPGTVIDQAPSRD